MKEKKSFFLWLLLFIFLTTYSFDSYKNIKNLPLSIKLIEIYGVNNSDIKKIRKKLELFKGKSLIFISRKEFKKSVSDLKFVKGLEVKKIYPDKIKIKVNEHKPIGIYIDKNKKFILTDSKVVIENGLIEEFDELPEVYGNGAEKKLYMFYSSLEKLDFKIEIIKQFKYFDINRWDIVLKNDKIIKLPSKNYEKSIKRFLFLYKKKNFSNFKVFDFRIKDQLILKK